MKGLGVVLGEMGGPSSTAKFFKSRYQNPSKIGGRGPHFWGSGASFWSHFGGLGGFWLPIASWEASGVASGRLSRPRWPQLGGQAGSQVGAKMVQKSMPKSIQLWMPF